MLAAAAAVVVQLLLLTPLHAQQNNQGNNPKQITDKDVTTAIEDRFLFDNAVPWSFVDVKTTDGIVTLTGSVNNLLARERATKIAESTKGVRAIVNNLTVQTKPRSDEEIRKDVETALLTDAAADGYEIKTAVDDAVVTLSGTVQSFQEQNLAAQLAKGIRGVKDVKNDITVKVATNRPDAELLADAKSALQHDVWVDASQMQVTADNGKITLTGKVGSAAEKTRARTLAWVAGVSAVDNQGVTVDPALARNTRPPGLNVVPDEEIEKAIKAALVHDPRVYSFNPEVQVNRGVVTLSGIVDNVKAKQAAEQDARNTLGVYRVKNHLKVRPTNPPPNDKLAQNVKDALQRDTVVDSFQVDVAAYNGSVTLTGAVDSNYEKSHAEDVANRINGVVRVRNNLQVKDPTVTYHNFIWDPYYAYHPYYRYWPTVALRSDAEIKDDIEDELFWSPFVDSDEVQVSVDNAVATLTGAVDSWSEFRSAAENAREGGASRVVNKLSVE